MSGCFPQTTNHFQKLDDKFQLANGNMLDDKFQIENENNTNEICYCHG